MNMQYPMAINMKIRQNEENTFCCFGNFQKLAIGLGSVGYTFNFYVIKWTQRKMSTTSYPQAPPRHTTGTSKRKYFLHRQYH